MTRAGFLHQAYRPRRWLSKDLSSKTKHEIRLNVPQKASDQKLRMMEKFKTGASRRGKKTRKEAKKIQKTCVVA